MANYAYAYNGKEDNAAKAVLKDGPISTKVAIEMCNYLRGKNTKAAKATLQRVLDMKEAIPFKRFTDGVGHRKGNLASGRYPQKASTHFIELIESVEANASQKGLSEDLKIIALTANKASTPYHFGRLRRRQMKRTHVEIVVVEDENAKKETKKAPAKKVEKKEAAPKVAAPKKEAPAKPAVKEEKPAAPKAEAPAPKAEPAKPEAKEEAPAKKEEVKEEKPPAPKPAEPKPTTEKPSQEKETAQQ